MESFSLESGLNNQTPARRSTNHFKYPEKPRPVTREEREHLLAVAERKEGQNNKQAEKHAQEKLERDWQAYSTATENTVSEAAMLCNELIRFQRNGLAIEQGLTAYRNRLQELASDLMSLKTNADSGVFNKLPLRDQKRLERLLTRNQIALVKIKEAQKESKFLENNTTAPFSAKRSTQKAEPRSVWTQKQKPEKQGLAARAWNLIKNPRKWFS